MNERIGELLVKENLLSAEQLARAREETRSKGGRLGAQITALGFDRATVVRVLQMVKRAEYKRRQAPPGVRVSSRAFGRDWRYPITSGY